MTIRSAFLLSLVLAACTACAPTVTQPDTPSGSDADSAVAGLLRGTSEWRIAESYPEQLFLEHADGRRSHWVAERPAP